MKLSNIAQYDADSSSASTTTMVSLSSLKSDCSDRTKKVTFATSARAKKTLTRKRYTLREKEATWYDMGDLEDIAQEIHFKVIRLDRGEIGSSTDHEDENDLDAKIIYMRGLEKQTQAGKLRSETMCRGAVDVVLKLQDAREDPDKIAVVYGERSKLCRYNAHVTAVTDAQVAHKIQRQPPQLLGGYRSSHPHLHHNVCRPHQEQKEEEDLQPQQCDVGQDEDCANRASKLLARRRLRIRKIVCTAA